MRVTLSLDDPVDVEIDEGVTVARLRAHLAVLTGDERWRAGTLTADGAPLHDEHPAGRPPLCHGTVLRRGAGPVPGAVAAARAACHLAVVRGPDCGALLVPDGPATLGPGGALGVDDGGRWLVRVRPGRGGRVLVRRLAGTGRLARPGRRWARAVPRWRWARWRVGEELRAGPSALVLRAADPGAGASSPAPPRRRTGWHRGAVRLLPAVASAATAVALAAVLHQPVLLLGALSALVVPLGGPPVTARPEETGPAGVPFPGQAGGPAGATTPVDLAALRVFLAETGAGGSPPPLASPVPWDGDLAIAGPREPALRLARAVLLAALVAEPRPVLVRTDRPAQWSWLAWFDGCSPGADGALVVLDGPAAAAWHPGAHVLRLVGEATPAWCRRVAEAGPDGWRLRDARGWRTVPMAGVSAGVAEAVARVAGRPRPTAPPTEPAVDLQACPADVALGLLPGVPPPGAVAVARAWASPPPGLPVPLGAGPGGVPLVLDLVADGPHALVAGTTGSGKSELLTTLVLGLALTQPPDRLAVVLVDFKGGTGLAPSLAALPHVVGHLSDLDAAGARRTLRGLSAELRRRERVLAERGVTDLRHLDPAGGDAPPRLLVVIDEFRALADDLPDLLPGLARIAAQGRSLGVHLVLATQRPTGAVPADLRANVGVRVALRVADAADSLDLVGVGDAARIGRPGLAVLTRGSGQAEPVQVARAVPRRALPVRLAPRWGADVGWAPRAGDGEPAWATGPAGDGPGDGAVRDGPSPDGVAAWVDAARRAGGRRCAEPWLPPLPNLVTTDDVGPGPGLPVAVADLPDELARGPVRWDPEAGHLLVAGGPGSGRSTALAAVAAAALAEGRPVHCVGLPPDLLPDHPGLRSRLEADDVTRVARLLRLLAGSRPPALGRRPLLVVDGVAGVLSGLAGLAHGEPADLLAEAWATAGGPVAVAAGGGTDAAVSRLAPWFADRLVLGSPDPSGDQLLGVPPHLAGPRPVPGRAVHLGRGTAALCQVALPVAGPAGPALPVPAGPAVASLPARVARPRDEASRTPAPVTLGPGGDAATPIPVDLDRPLLVVGPPGSGRTNALAVLASGAARAGLRVVALDGAPLPDGALLPDDPDALLVADDLDELESRHPVLAEALAARLASGGPLRLLAATSTAHAAAAYHGPVAALVRARQVVVLDLAEPGSLELLGVEGAWLVDPRRRPPGRGALRSGRAVVPVQVWAPDEPRRDGVSGV